MGIRKKVGLNAGAFLEQTQRLISEKTPEVVAMLPQNLEEIRVNELWRQWPRGTGKPFESFTEAITAPQPYGLGLGQYHQWIRPFQVYHLCDGFRDLQMALRPVVVERLPAMRQGQRTDLEHPSNGRKLQAAGNGEEYLVRRLKAEDAKNGTDFAGKWARGEYRSVRQAAIAAGIVKVTDSDKTRSPLDRIRNYWNRAGVAERRAIAAMIASAGLKKISK